MLRGPSSTTWTWVASTTTTWVVRRRAVARPHLPPGPRPPPWSSPLPPSSSENPAVAPTSLNEGRGDLVSSTWDVGRRHRRHGGVTWRMSLLCDVAVVVDALWSVAVVIVSLSLLSLLCHCRCRCVAIVVVVLAWPDRGHSPWGHSPGVRRRRQGRMVVVGVERGGGKKCVTWRRLNHGCPIWVLPNLALLNYNYNY